MTARPSPENVRPADTAIAAGRALRRGLAVLDALQRAGADGLRVIDICRTCGLDRAPVYRLLATLIDCGHARQHDRFRYAAVAALRQPAATELAAASALPVDDLARRLQPLLARVSSGCGDAAFAVVREGHSAWCVARHVGTWPVQILSVQVGSRQPLGVGAAGLALLAALPHAEADAAIVSYGDALGRYGGMTAPRLRILVQATRERGWSVVGNHAVKGATGVGMAVLDVRGQPLAAISVAAAMDRMPRQRQQLIAGLMRDALAGGV